MTIKEKNLKRKRSSPILKQSKVRLAIDCTSEERRAFKLFAAYEDKTLNEFVLDCVKSKINSCLKSHIPNEKTAKVLRDTDNKKNIISHDSIDDFWEALGFDKNA